MWAKFTHSVLGFYDDALWCLCVEIVGRKLVEMMGRVNLGLNVRMVVMWVEKCEVLRVWKAKFGVSGNWGLKWVNPSLKCYLGLVGKPGLSKGEKWVTKVKAKAISRVNWVLRGQILNRWSFHRKTSLRKFKIMLYTCLRWEFAPKLPYSHFHFSNHEKPLNWGVLDT